MIGKFHILEVIKDGHKSLYTDIDGYIRNKASKIIIFDLAPIIISFVLFFMTDFSQHLKEFSSDILTGISIFSGLLFSLIIVIVDKAKTRKTELINNKNDEIKNYVNKYLRFSEQLISQISLSIIYSFTIIIILILSSISIDFFEVPLILNKILFSMGIITIVYFSIQFFILLLIIISGMYSVFISDISE